GPSPASQAADKKAQFSASISGDLTSFLLPDVLEFLRLQTKTGSLMVASRQGAGIVRMVRGQITSASAPGVQRLGEALVERGIITRAGLQAALARQKGNDGEISETLAWSEGAFSFHPEAEKDLPAIAFDVQNVMLELMRLTDERNQQRVSNP